MRRSVARASACSGSGRRSFRLAKRQQFERKLLARGTARAALARLVCPIGRSAAPALRGKAPGVIALAVAAEIVAVHERAVAAGADAAVVTEHAR